MTTNVEHLIHRRRGLRSTTAVGRAIGIRQLSRTIQGCADSRTLRWPLVEDLAAQLDVSTFEVTAAFGADAGVELVNHLRPAQVRLAQLVGELDNRGLEDLIHTLRLLLQHQHQQS